MSLQLEQLQCVNNKKNCQFLVGHICVGKFTFIKIEVQKKSKFAELLKVNMVYFFKCLQFFLRLAYNCSQVIILILFLVNILRSFFLIQQFNERFEIFQNSRYIKRSFCSVFGYTSFYIQLISFAAKILHSSFDKNFILRAQFFFLVNFFLQLLLYSLV